MGNMAAGAAGEGEDSGAKEREAKADTVRRPAVRVHSDHDGNRSPEGGDLTKSQINENDPPLNDVHAEIRVDPRENEACDTGREQENEDSHPHSPSVTLFRPAPAPAS